MAGEEIEALSYFTDDFGLRKIHLFDRGWREANMNDLMSAPRHQERRLLNRLVPNGNDEVRAIDCPVDVVAFAQGSGAEIEVRRTPDSPFSHLCIEERDTDATNEVGKRRRKLRSICPGAKHQQRKLRGQNKVGCALDGSRRGNRNLHRVGRHQRDISRFFLGDVFGQFEMYGAGALFGRYAKCIPDEGRNTRRTHDLLGLFRERTHRRDDIDDLEPRLSALSNRFLTGDQHHRHAPKKSVSGARDEIERAWTERAERDPRLSRKSPIRGCHERCRLFMTGCDQLDGGLPKAFDDIEVLFTRYPIDSIDALVLESRNEKI